MSAVDNTNRFSGFSEEYNASRPRLPEDGLWPVLRYLHRQPKLCVDLGSGTGLSTAVLAKVCAQVIGIEPNSDMLQKARENLKNYDNVRFIQAAAESTGLDAGSADLIFCSQSFHWMEPKAALREADRLLCTGGVFAAADYDWPGICGWEAEAAYEVFMQRVLELLDKRPKLSEGTYKWPKSRQLQYFREYGNFRYIREAVFYSEEPCDAKRYLNMVLSQSYVQIVKKAFPKELDTASEELFQEAQKCFQSTDRIRFNYRMRIGVK